MRLKEIRLKRELTQKDLEAKSGIAQATISELEAGKNINPTLSTAIALAKALEVPVENLDFSPPGAAT